jgi:hypothetical protein
MLMALLRMDRIWVIGRLLPFLGMRVAITPLSVGRWLTSLETLSVIPTVPFELVLVNVWVLPSFLNKH